MLTGVDDPSCGCGPPLEPRLRLEAAWIDGPVEERTPVAGLRNACDGDWCGRRTLAPAAILRLPESRETAHRSPQRPSYASLPLADGNDSAGAEMILGHLDLDAFFAAVEELENPELRLEAADRRRRPARARCRRDRELRGAQVRDRLGDVLRRGAAAVPARDLRPAEAQRVPRVLGHGLGGGPRGRADRRAHRARRGVPRLRRDRRELRRGACARRGGADVRARRDEPERSRSGWRPPRSWPRSRATAESRAG